MQQPDTNLQKGYGQYGLTRQLVKSEEEEVSKEAKVRSAHDKFNETHFCRPFC